MMNPLGALLPKFHVMSYAFHVVLSAIANEGMRRRKKRSLFGGDHRPYLFCIPRTDTVFMTKLLNLIELIIVGIAVL